MPKIRLVCFIPTKSEVTDENGNTIYSVNIQGKKGPNSVSPGPNSEFFATAQASPQITLGGLNKATFDAIKGKSAIVTIETGEEGDIAPAAATEK